LFFDGSSSNTEVIIIDVIQNVTVIITLMLTIPRSHVTKEGTASSRWYLLSFLLGFAWVSLWSYVISTIVERYVTLTNLGGGYYGVMLVCLGAEVPDLIQCVSVAKRGYGSMAIANVVGSQVINILIGLGLPWFISSSIGSDVKVKGYRDLSGASAFLMFDVVMVCLLLIAPICYNCKKPVFEYWKGKILVGLYGITICCYTLWYFLLLKDERGMHKLYFRKGEWHWEETHN
jgi:Ca2+/Na+ antiporter